MDQNIFHRILLLLVLLMGMTTGIEAQQKFRPELALGLRVGYQFSQVNFDVGIPQRLHQGYTAGLVLQYLSQKQIGVQLEVNYSQRGLSGPAPGSALTVIRSFDYIEIPLLTHFAIGKKSFRVILNAGSYLSFLASEVSKNAVSAEAYYLNPLDRNWTYGLMGGLGFALRTRLGVFQIEGRGALGFTDLFSAVDQDIFTTSPELFFNAQFTYLYRFGKASNNLDPIPNDTSTDNF